MTPSSPLHEPRDTREPREYPDHSQDCLCDACAPRTCEACNQPIREGEEKWPFGNGEKRDICVHAACVASVGLEVE